MHNIKKLLDEVEYDIINHQSRGLSYLLKLKAGADNTDIGLIIHDIMPKLKSIFVLSYIFKTVCIRRYLSEFVKV